MVFLISWHPHCTPPAIARANLAAESTSERPRVRLDQPDYFHRADSQRSADALLVCRDHRGADDLDRAESVQSDRPLPLLGDGTGLRMVPRAPPGGLRRNRFFTAYRNSRHSVHPARRHSECCPGADSRLRVSPGAKPPASDSPWMRVSIDEVVIEVTARPGSSRLGVIGVSGVRLLVAIHSRPDKGKANDELIEYLAHEMRVPRSALLIVRGETSRRKTFRIVTHEPIKVSSRLRQIVKAK